MRHLCFSLLICDPRVELAAIFGDKEAAAARTETTILAHMTASFTYMDQDGQSITVTSKRIEVILVAK